MIGLGDEGASSDLLGGVATPSLGRRGVSTSPDGIQPVRDYVPTWQEAGVLEGALKAEPEGERRKRMELMLGRYQKQRAKQLARVEGFYGKQGLEGFFEGLEPQAREKWEPLLAQAHNREEVLAGAANLAWFAAVRPDLAERALADWGPYRAAVAEQMGYTGEGPISERELYARIQGQVTAKQTRAQRGKRMAAVMWRAGLEGSSEHWLDAYRAVGVPVFDDPNQPQLEWPISERDFYRDQARAAFAAGQEQAQRLRPLRDKVLGSLARDTNADGRGSGWMGFSQEELIEELMELPEEDRQLVYGEVARGAQTSEHTQHAREEKGAAQIVAEKFGRFVAEMWRNTTTDASRIERLAAGQRALAAYDEEGEKLWLREGSEHELFTQRDSGTWSGVGTVDVTGVIAGLEGATGEKARETRGIREATKEEIAAFRERLSADEKRFVIEGELRALAEGEIDPARFENRFVDNLAEAPGQLAYMAQMKLPWGVGYALFYRGNVAMRTKELLGRGVPLHRARDMAQWSSLFEGLVEMGQASMVFGKLPAGLGKVLKGPLKSLGTGEVAKRGAAVFAAEYATQNLQEFAQDVSTLIMQDWAAWSNEAIPATRGEDWREFWSSRLDTAVVLLPMALLGTGLAVGIHDRAWAKGYLSNREYALANGFVPEVADQIATLATDGKIEQAEALLQESWRDPQKRRPTLPEQLQAIDELAFEAEEAEKQYIESGRVTQLEGGGYEVRDGEGRVFDVVSKWQDAYALADELIALEEELQAEARARELAEQQAREQAEEQQRQEEWLASPEGQRAAQYERVREVYVQEAAQAEANPREVSAVEIDALAQRRQRAFEMLDRRVRAMETRKDKAKARREHDAALKQAQELDEAYAVAWFQRENYVRDQLALVGSRDVVGELGPALSNPWKGDQQVSLPDNKRKSAYTDKRVGAEEQRVQSEQASQEAGDNVQADVGSAELSLQAADTLDRTQRRGVQGMPDVEAQAQNSEEQVEVFPEKKTTSDSLAKRSDAASAQLRLATTRRYERAKAKSETKLTQGQWSQVHTPEFKTWFGDWQKLRAQQRMDAMEPVELQLDEKHRDADTGTLRKAVTTHLDSLAEANTRVEHPELGEITFSKNNTGKAIHMAVVPEKLHAALDIVRIIKNSHLVETQPSDDSTEAKNGVIYHTVVAKVSAFGREFVSVVTIKEHPQGQRFYSSTAVYNPVNKEAPSVSPRARRKPETTSALHGAGESNLRPLRRVNPELVSQAVDPDTGEPLVFYHGGRGDFTQLREGGRFGQMVFLREGQPADYRAATYPLFLRGKILEAEQLATALEGERGEALLRKHSRRREVTDEAIEEIIDSVREQRHYPEEVAWDALGAVDEADAQVEYQGLLGKLARELGFDAVRVADEFDGETVAVVEPMAIKSAIGNRGTFDGENPDILGSPLRQGMPNAARTSLTGDPAAAGKKPVTMPQVMGAIADVAVALGRDKRSMNRVGRMGSAGGGRRLLGSYQPHSEVTRIRTAGDFTTAAHELAHAIDDALWGHEAHWRGNALGLSPAVRGELHKLGKDLYKENEPHNGYHSEGFAEFVRLWLTDEPQARAKAPEFAKHWAAEVLGKNPKLAEAVTKAQQVAHRYLAQGALSRGRAAIAHPPSTTEALVEGAKREVSLLRKRFIEAAVEVEAFAAQAAARRGDEGGKLPVRLDPMETLRAGRRKAEAVVGVWATEGLTDFGDNPTGVAPLVDAFKLITEEQLEDFIVYLVARRAHALWTDPRGPRNGGIDAADAAYLVQTLGSPQFERAAGIIYAWNEGALDYVAQASPAMAEVVRRIREVDPGFYIPLHREFAEVERRYRSGGGSGTAAARAELTKRLRGSGRRIKPVVESMLAQTKELVLRAHQRRVIDQVLHLARTVRGLGHYAVEVPVARVPVLQRSFAELLEKVEGVLGTKGAITEQLEAAGADNLLGQMVTFFAPAAEPKAGEWPVLPVWEDGRMKWYELDPELYAAVAEWLRSEP